MIQAEREQRIQALNRMIADLLAERQLIEEKWRGNVPPDDNLRLAVIKSTIERYQDERTLLESTEFTPEMVLSLMTRTWNLVSTLEAETIPHLLGEVATLRDMVKRSRRPSVHSYMLAGAVMVLVLIDLLTVFAGRG